MRGLRADPFINQTTHGWKQGGKTNTIYVWVMEKSMYWFEYVLEMKTIKLLISRKRTEEVYTNNISDILSGRILQPLFQKAFDHN